ncbi:MULTISPECIES: M23 family metallopeptidase [Micromonospora]|uniref:M23 family peptidase n=1 Tax=Micromonospora solifontis TaxID=2487138 RepID=A0ABX9WDK6_9ACTN|nr:MULTISPECIES: M23 family metallopeptidase [Micromonospora]NES16784.1 peptidoglycan DD-metalloendopeptidase family protein [Micromonospora sp. PPF5-17B]NES37802.1 peptidoglycan DD-metalloendopeptidase family protein [Micromonospora solifontis]NES59161.1 peptidoglycan DD-metalloendopeptidase family protein [Micromonospora sp. PPF5-6]RNL97902.1 M23 family peptidase [Micromonospora solifontis]
MRKRWLSLAAVGAVLAAILVPATPAMAAPTFKVPFPCNQSWSGQTRSDHSPAYAIDFNRTDDLGDPVVASAPGTVDRVTDLGGTSYGKYVRIDHGNGYTTYYAHLGAFNVSVGQTVGYGKVIGYVGSTGGSTGPHLHYEQRLNGNDIQARFNGALALYWGTKTYTSDNGCSGTNYGTGTVNTTSGVSLTVRSGPGTGYSAVGSVADGATVTIYCQTSGTSVTGTYGTSSIWDRIGTGRYVSDAYVYTGYDGYIPSVPRC